MGNCTYCGLKAGFLKSKHAECESKFIESKKKIVLFITESITKDSDFNILDDAVHLIANTNFIKPEELDDLYTNGFDKAVELFLDDGILSVDEEEKITKFKKYYNFSQNVLDKNGSLQKVIKSSILREIQNGNIPEQKISIQGTLPFLLQKGESVIWIFQNVEFYEMRSKTVYQGRSNGVSIRVAKGLYYRTSAFKGNPVKIEQMQHISNGILALTNKNLYFSSSSKSIKLPFNKILTLDPYEDGVGIHKDGINSKPQVFKGLDGWFTYNLISCLNQL
jgi:hypothetical protein